MSAPTVNQFPPHSEISMSLRPLNVRKRRPSWYDDDPPAPLGSERARIEAQEQFLEQYEELEAEDDGRASPSYRRPDH